MAILSIMMSLRIRSIYHIKAVFSEQSFAHMGAERQTNIQTNIHTYKHTHFSENNFSKPGVRPQLAFEFNKVQWHDRRIVAQGYQDSLSTVTNHVRSRKITPLDYPKLYLRVDNLPIEAALHKTMEYQPIQCNHVA